MKTSLTANRRAVSQQRNTDPSIPFRPTSVRQRRSISAKRTALFEQASGPLALRGPSINVASCSHQSLDEEFNVTDDSVHPILREGQILSRLQRQLNGRSLEEKIATLASMERVQAFLSHPGSQQISDLVETLSPEDLHLVLTLPAIGQSHVLQQATQGTNGSLKSAMSKLLAVLRRVEGFYDSIGGILGYQLKSLQLIAAGMEELREEQAAKLQGKVVCHDDPFSMIERRFLVPKPVDLAAEDGREVARAAALQGLQAMPFMAEIYPVGGAGDRLGLTDEFTGECLPAAMLPYCGRTMLEVLVRDLQAREHLYFRLTGKQVVTPVAIMTSDAKGNHHRITELMEQLRWFGRGRDAFRLFRQPLVPVMSIETGKWLLSDQMQPMTKPGGHGAIWKLLRDEGIFAWLKQRGRQAAVVRQISNPMAGTDTTLLSLTGVGASRKAAFGFMSCDRHVGAAEGVNVLQENKIWRDGRWQYDYGLTNIEYTEFDRLGITDQPLEGASGAAQLSVFPANTNVLYVDLHAAEAIVQKAIDTGSSDKLMPGLIFNLKKKVVYKDPLQSNAECKVHAGRMESTMQNMADYMVKSFDTPLSPSEAASEQLPTFLVYNHRRKVTSSAKKKRDPGSLKISQTPDGSFYDLQRNAWQLLQQCGLVGLPELGSIEQYLSQGPGFIFLYNPALGPLWDIIAQKISGGSLGQGSEMVLEVAEARLRDVSVSGSLLVYAENVVGHMAGPLTVHGLQYGEQGVEVEARLPNELAMRHVSTQVMEASLDSWARATSSDDVPGASTSSTESGGDMEERLVFSSNCGRVHMSNVTVRNRGVDWTSKSNLYWKHQVKRHEAARIVLQGRSEFEAQNVVISGDQTFTVPDGFRMVVSQNASGSLVQSLEPLGSSQPSWQWVYSASDNDDGIRLEFERATHHQQSQ